MAESSIWDNFDGNNITDEQRNELLADMYGGYKQKQGKEIWIEKGAGSGRAKVATGRYKTSTNLDYYKNHPGWKGVADAADISSINSLTDLGQMADYVSHYGKNKEEPIEPEPEEETNNSPDLYKLSQRAAEANAGTKAYEDVLLGRQGDNAFGNDRAPEQQYKDAYQDNLTEELKAKDPATLATAQAKYELADKQAADMADSFDLSLDSPSSNKNLKFT